MLTPINCLMIGLLNSEAFRIDLLSVDNRALSFDKSTCKCELEKAKKGHNVDTIIDPVVQDSSSCT